MMRQVLCQIYPISAVLEIVKAISLLQALTRISQSLKSTETLATQKYFQQCGFEMEPDAQILQKMRPLLTQTLLVHFLNLA